MPGRFVYPWLHCGTIITRGGVTWTGSVADGDGTICVMLPGPDNIFAPPYAYTPDLAALVSSLVPTHAGAGKGPFAP